MPRTFQTIAGQLTLLHVIEYFPEDRSNREVAPENVDPAAYRDERARNALAELARQLDYDRLLQEMCFSSESARHAIVRFAEEQGADLIVIASHGRHGITSILGSTAYGVTQSAGCDVLTVRAKTG